MSITNSNFDILLKFSEKKAMLIQAILKTKLNADYVEKNQGKGNDHGIDYISHRGRQEIYIDAKVRDIDYPGDVALEIWSNREAGKVGWTLDPTKLSDYIFWLWEDYCYMVPARELREVFKKNLEEWKTKYRRATQRTGNYHSECIFIPLEEGEKEIEKIKRNKQQEVII